MSSPRQARIGNQTSYCAESAELPFEFALEHNFAAFEWFPDKRSDGRGWLAEDLSPGQRTRIRSAAAEHDIRLSVHASLRASPLHQQGLALLRQDLQLASDLCAAIFNIHLDAHTDLQDFLRAIDPVLGWIAQERIALAIENTPSTTPDHFNELFRLLGDRAVPTDAKVGMCLDVGHANLCESTRNDYLRFVDLIQPHVPIIHLHLHENFGDEDSHLPIFSGPSRDSPSGVVGLMDRLRQRRFDGGIIFEQWPTPAELLLESRERVLQILSDGASGG